MVRSLQYKNLLQHGGALLVSVVMLLALTALATLSALRQQVFVNRMSVNTQNLALAHSNAESGLAIAVNKLQSDPTFIKSEIQTDIKALSQNLGRAKVTITRQTTPRFSHRMEMIKLSATGYGPDNLSKFAVSQYVLRYPLLRADPTTPIFIKGSLNVKADLAVVYSQPKKHMLNDKLIWLAGDLNGKQKIVTCPHKRYLVHDCHDNDIAAIAKLHRKDKITQLLPFLFNLSKSDWRYLQDEFTLVTQSCDRKTLTGTLSTLWVTGDCWLENKTELGTPDQPVLFVVHNGNLHFRGHNKVYGLIVLLSTSVLESTHKITTNGMNKIYGTLAANSNIVLAGDKLDILFDKKAFERLYKMAPMWRITPVPGSWQDFR